MIPHEFIALSKRYPKKLLEAGLITDREYVQYLADADRAIMDISSMARRATYAEKRVRELERIVDDVRGAVKGVG